MKKVINVLMVIAVCGCLICGCGDMRLDGNLDTGGEIASQFIVLEEWSSVTGLCYDKDTKIIYIYSVCGDFNSFATYSYTPYYVRDMNDNAVIAIYNGDE